MRQYPGAKERLGLGLIILAAIAAFYGIKILLEMF